VSAPKNIAKHNRPCGSTIGLACSCRVEERQREFDVAQAERDVLDAARDMARCFDIYGEPDENAWASLFSGVRRGVAVAMRDRALALKDRIAVLDKLRAAQGAQ
jgi:hypothetical protein